MSALPDGEIHDLGKCLAQNAAAVVQLLEIHLGVVAPEVVVGGANESDHFRFSISDFRYSLVELILLNVRSFLSVTLFAQ